METDPAALGEFVDTAERALFRIEGLPEYDDGSDGSDYQRYLRGEPGPDPQRKAAWHKVLQADLDRGVVTRRVRIIHAPPTEYELYSCEWGYALNAAYERIRIADLAARPGSALLAGEPDFWLVDERRAAIMHYSAGGAYMGYTEADAEGVAHCLAIADAAWQLSIPFDAWWAAHRRLWRENRSAA